MQNSYSLFLTPSGQLFWVIATQIENAPGRFVWTDVQGFRHVSPGETIKLPVPLFVIHDCGQVTEKDTWPPLVFNQRHPGALAAIEFGVVVWQRECVTYVRDPNPDGKTIELWTPRNSSPGGASAIPVALLRAGTELRDLWDGTTAYPTLKGHRNVGQYELRTQPLGETVATTPSNEIAALFFPTGVFGQQCPRLEALLWFACMRARERGDASAEEPVPFIQGQFVRSIGPTWYRILADFIRQLRDSGSRLRLHESTPWTSEPTVVLIEGQSMSRHLKWPFDPGSEWDIALRRYLDEDPDKIAYKG